MPAPGIPIIPLGTADGARPMPSAGYLRPDSSGFISMTPPALRSRNQDVKAAYRRAASYATDALQNSGWIAGGIDQAVTDTVGSGLRLSAKPDADRIGFQSEDAARGWGDEVEKHFADWARDPYECDAAGKQTLHQMADSGVRYHFAFGEYFAANELFERPGATSFLKIKMLSPLSLTMDTNAAIGLDQGIFKDPNGMPTSYRFHQKVDGVRSGTLDIRARDRDGRPQIIHVFDGMPGQMRGITPLAPVLKVTRQYDQLADATLTAALLQTIFAASLKSSGLSDEAFQGLLTERDQKKASSSLKPTSNAADLNSYIEAQLSWYETFKFDLGAHGRIAQVFPGQELEFHSNNHPNENYKSFTSNLLREIARMIGVLYESLSLDYEGATYSSLLTGLATIWPIVLRRRGRIAVPLYQAAYEAFLDEWIYERRIDFPGGYDGFVRNRAAACRAQWGGPPKPQADELKGARAQTERLDNGSSSIGHEAMERGLDVEDIARQRSRDIEVFERHGLANPYDQRRSGETLDADGLRPDEV